MPGIDGFEVCARVHETESNRTTPVIFVTSHSGFESREKSAEVGGHELIAKPFLAFEITVKALTLLLKQRLALKKAETPPSDSPPSDQDAPAAAVSVADSENAVATPTESSSAQSTTITETSHLTRTEVPAAPKPPARKVNATPRILIVDDDPLMHLLYKRNLEREGFELLKASNGEEALVIAAESNPDLILMDVMMPGMDGMAVIGELRQNDAFRDVPIIVMTANADQYQTTGKEAQLRHAQGFLTKPLSPQKLVSEVRRFLPAITPC